MLPLAAGELGFGGLSPAIQRGAQILPFAGGVDAGLLKRLGRVQADPLGVGAGGICTGIRRCRALLRIPGSVLITGCLLAG